MHLLVTFVVDCILLLFSIFCHYLCAYCFAVIYCFDSYLLFCCCLLFWLLFTVLLLFTALLLFTILLLLLCCYLLCAYCFAVIYRYMLWWFCLSCMLPSIHQLTNHIQTNKILPNNISFTETLARVLSQRSRLHRTAHCDVYDDVIMNMMTYTWEYNQ